MERDEANNRKDTHYINKSAARWSDSINGNPIIAIGTAGFVYGVKSRPLFIPTNNDGFTICYNLA